MGGLALIVVLIVKEYRGRRPLLTIRAVMTSTIPVAGIVVALCAAAASVSATTLTANALAGHYSPIHIGLLYLPEFAGAVLTAILFGFVLNRIAFQYRPPFGMLFLAAGILVFRIDVPSSQAFTLVGSGLTGIGLGTAVAPALFAAGMSLPSRNLQRVFAIIELLRAVATFMIAPIFVHFALTVRRDVDAGTGLALWIGFGLALEGARWQRSCTCSRGRVVDRSSPPQSPRVHDRNRHRPDRVRVRGSPRRDSVTLKRCRVAPRSARRAARSAGPLPRPT